MVYFLKKCLKNQTIVNIIVFDTQNYFWIFCIILFAKDRFYSEQKIKKQDNLSLF